MSLTRQFWENIGNYETYISELVIDEIKQASQPLQSEMMDKIKTFQILPITENAQYLTDIYIKNQIFPEKYIDDALHTALASTNQVGILLSWNFAHLVKIKTRRMVALINTMHTYSPIEIITPPEL
jgi:hypothetical protein